MWWQVRYYDGALPLRVVTSDDIAIEELDADGVIDITVAAPDGYQMVLVGADWYYLADDGQRFGLFNDDDQSEQHFRWSQDDGFTDTEPVSSPRWLAGREMPDEQAHVIGLR